MGPFLPFNCFFCCLVLRRRKVLLYKCLCVVWMAIVDVLNNRKSCKTYDNTAISSKSTHSFTFFVFFFVFFQSLPVAPSAVFAGPLLSFGPHVWHHYHTWCTVQNLYLKLTLNELSYLLSSPSNPAFIWLAAPPKQKDWGGHSCALMIYAPP